MAAVELRGLSKTFTAAADGRTVHALSDLTLQIRDGEFLVLVGPSGCGKSTALRLVAGLEELSAGQVLIGGQDVTALPPRERDVAMVFQNYALYPHLSVYDNLAFGLRRRRLPGLWARLTRPGPTRRVEHEIDAEVRRAASLLELEALLKRKPGQLSGGQRQRVALGRAMVRNPRVFLMDEPLSNLDARLRGQTRAELIRLHRRLGITTLYVTHDQAEAMTMGQRIAVLKDGTLQGCDTPHELYHHPPNQFVAGFLGTPPMNFFPLVRAGAHWRTEDGWQVPLTPEQAPRLPAEDGARVTAGVRPEAMRPGAEGWPARVDVIEPLGAQTILYVQAGENSLAVTVAGDSRWQPGETVHLHWDATDSHFFSAQTGESIPASPDASP